MDSLAWSILCVIDYRLNVKVEKWKNLTEIIEFELMFKIANVWCLTDHQIMYDWIDLSWEIKILFWIIIFFIVLIVTHYSTVKNNSCFDFSNCVLKIENTSWIEIEPKSMVFSSNWLAEISQYFYSY